MSHNDLLDRVEARKCCPDPLRPPRVAHAANAGRCV
jgi:hypothetical protein